MHIFENSIWRTACMFQSKYFKNEARYEQRVFFVPFEQNLIFLCFLALSLREKALEYLHSASTKILNKVNQFSLANPVFYAQDCYLMVNSRLNASPGCKQTRVGSIHK